MKLNYIAILNIVNKSLQDNECNVLSPYVEVELTDASAKLICKLLESISGVEFKSTSDASNPEIISQISGYFCSQEAQEQFHKKVSEETILKSIDVNGDGNKETVIVAPKDIVDMSNDRFRSRATAYICIGVLFASYMYLFFVTFGSSFIDPDNNARFVDQILSNINSVINMVVMFIINIFFLGSRYARKTKEDKDDIDQK